MVNTDILPPQVHTHGILWIKLEIDEIIVMQDQGGSSGGSQQDRQRQKSRQKRRFSAHNSFLPDIQAGTSLPILPFIMRWFFP